MTKPISLQLYTVRDLTRTPEGFRDTLRKIAEIGYVAVESGTSPAGMKPAEYRKFLDDLGLKLSSSWAQPTKENVNELADHAALFGFDCYVGCYGPDQFKTVEGAKRTAAAFEEMAQLLAGRGLTMCYHNHWWEFVQLDGRYGWDIVMENAPTLQAEIDCYWASNFGEVDVPAVVRQYRDRAPLLHMKDGPLVKDQPNVAVGDGKLDNGACVKQADPQRLEYLIVELDAFAGDVMEAVRDSYAFLTAENMAHGRA